MHNDAAAPRTLITGASSGIGTAYAHAFAARGDGLILVARSTDRLEALAADLRARHGIAVDVIPADLTDPAAPERIVAAITARGISVGTLINNAGFGAHGEFAALDAQRQIEMIAVNVTAPVALARALLPQMRERRRGAIVNVASTAAFQPVPYMAVYGATKAFLLSFSQALAEEVRADGITVLALCPGQTTTEFFAVAGESARVGTARTTADVVRTTLRALERRRTVAIDGLPNALLANSTPFMPRALVARIGAALMRPRPSA